MSYSMSDLLQLVVSEGASDLHIRVGTAPTIRVHGILHRVEGPALGPEDSEELMRSITSEDHIQHVRERGGARASLRALNARGIHAVLVGTGQTSIIQGARYGVALDAIPAQFCSGEMEAAVVEAFEGEHPDVIIVEGQGALSHPAYLSSTFILRGSRPDAVILQHAPARRWLGDFADVPMPAAAKEIALIETFADTRVIGLTINHENMSDAEVSAAIVLYESELGIPVTDALTRPTDLLVDMVVRAFPKLESKLAPAAE